MQELFSKYIDNQCSPAEVKALLAYFGNPENELLFRRLIFESLEDGGIADNHIQFQEATDRLFARIDKKIKDEEGGHAIRLTGKIWFRAAAAVIIFAGAFFIFNYFNTVNTSREIGKADTLFHEIGPGGNKAILILANGATINLETAKNEILAKQGSTNLVKVADGEISYRPEGESNEKDVFNIIKTPRGGNYKVQLPDGSIAWLNAASYIRFPVSFTGSERVVELTGEGYFEVTNDKSSTFRAKIAGRAEVEVLGTHFNISAYEDDSAINTTLLEGKVKFVTATESNSKIISPGEQVTLNATGKIEINKANREQVVAWKNGIFSFHHADLEMSLRQIARWYDVDIVFEGSIPKKKFNGEMQRTLNLSQVIKLLEKSEVYCRIKGRQLIVKA